MAAVDASKTASSSPAPASGSIDGAFEAVKGRLNKLVNESREASVDVNLSLPTAVVIGALGSATPDLTRVQAIRVSASPHSSRA